MDDEKIRKSFEKVKEDIIALKGELSQNKALLEEIKNQLIDFKKPISNEKPKSSIGNEGAYSFIHSFNRHSTDIHALNIHSPDPNESLKLTSFENFRQVEEVFKSLTKQEFLTFMTLYQLEDDLNRNLTYSELSKYLKLSEGCIRTYLSQMIKKGLPIVKTRHNNKLILLGVNSHFRDLGFKTKLFNLLNQIDPSQTRLNEL